jgi:serine/threonine-protein kinase
MQLQLPAVGAVFAARYRLERVVGQGAMACVYAARHVQRNELVALKLLHPRVMNDARSVERFLREARACATIQNGHSVKVLEVLSSEGGNPPGIVMEFLVGEDLGHIVANNGAFPITTAVDYVLQACEAIAEAHAHGIVHRDIKPANLRLALRTDGAPIVKVLDFGISKIPVSEEEARVDLTETTSAFGSPTYMSPEQVRSSKHVDARADVWSLGVVLFELLAGTVPFRAASITGLIASIVSDPPRALKELRADVPDGLAQAVDLCLQKNRDKRIQSVQELARQLAAFASANGRTSVDVITSFPPAPKIDGSIAPGARPSSRMPPPGSASVAPPSNRSSLPEIVHATKRVSGPPAKPKGSGRLVAVLLAIVFGVAAAIVAIKIFAPSLLPLSR